MPAKSKKQANLFKAALGKHPKGAAANIKKTLSKKKIKEFTHESFNSLVNQLLNNNTLEENKAAALFAAAGLAAGSMSSANDIPKPRPGVSRIIAPEDQVVTPVDRLLLIIKKKPTIIDFSKIEQAFNSLDNNIKDRYNNIVNKAKSTEERKRANTSLIQLLDLPDNVKADLIKTASI